MAQLPADQAVTRLQANEDRFDTFANKSGPYITSDGVSVESLPAFMGRKETEINRRFQTARSRGNWATGTAYALNDLVVSGAIVYMCLVDHTSTVFATDLTAAKWVIFQGLTPNAAVDVFFKEGFFPYTANDVHSYGDSITATVGASAPTNGYVNLLAARLQWNLVNHAISGGSIMDWIANAYGYDTTDDSISTILPGFNDARFVGTNAAQQAAYKLALYAAVAHLAIPNSKKLKGDNPAISYVGSWAVSPVRAYGRYTSTVNDTATFKVSGDVIYISTIQQVSFGGLMNVVVDGVDKGNFNLCQSVGNGGAVSNRDYMPMLIRIPGLGDGLHTVVCKANGKDVNSQSNTIYVDWVAGSGSRAKTNAVVYVGNTLRMNAAGYGGGAPYNKATDAVMAAFSKMSQQVCGDLATDGLDVAYVDASGAYEPNTEIFSDNIHPADLGHASIASAFVNATKSKQRPAFAGVLAQVRNNRNDIIALQKAYVAPSSGTFVPVLFGFTNPGVHTYTKQVGNYKIDNGVCVMSFEVQISVFDASMTGPLCVNLPVACSALNSSVGVVGERSGITLSANCSGLYLETVPGDTKMVIRQSASGATELTPVNFTAPITIRGTVSYLL